MPLIYIALGGAIGSVLRYGLVQAAGRAFGAAFPYGTYAVNILGSLMMGLLMGVFAKYAPDNQDELRLFLAVGVLGGFTTFSAFSFDVVALIQAQQTATAVFYALSSVVFSVLALMAGLWLVR